jgi:hypothetical protein
MVVESMRIAVEGARKAVKGDAGYRRIGFVRVQDFAIINIGLLAT